LSPVFSAHLALEANLPHIIQSDVCEASVIEFLKLFQNEEPVMTTDVAYDMKTLSEEFVIECFLRFVQEFIGLNKYEAIIDRIRHSFERGSEPTPLEQELRDDFIHFIETDQIFELPLSCLVRNAALPPSPTPDQIAKFIDFILSSLDHYGSVASILLRGVDQNQLSFSQTRRLIERRDITWCFLGSFRTVSVMECLNSHARLLKDNDSLRMELASQVQR
jgi:hypothetical protein